MEMRDGLIEFRITKIPVYDKKGKIKRYERILEYRQIFKGIWTEWKQIIDENEDKLYNLSV